MASEENIAAGVFELRAEGGQFSAVIANLTEVSKRFERVVLESFNKAGAAASSTQALEASSKRYVSAIEREALAIERKTASLVLSISEQRKAEAQARGLGDNAEASAAIAKLASAEQANKRLLATLQQVADINAFGDLLNKSQSLGQVEKNIDSLTASLNRLQGEAREAASVRLSVASVDEARSRQAAETALFDARAAGAAKLNRANEYITMYTGLLEQAEIQEKEMANVKAFDALLADSAKLGQVEKNIDSLTASLNRLQGEAREAASVKLSNVRLDEGRRTEAATAVVVDARFDEVARARANADSVQVLTAYLDKLERNEAFATLLNKSQALGQVGANVDSLTAALDRLDETERASAQSRIYESRVAEAAKLGQAEQYIRRYAESGQNLVAAERAFAGDQSFINALKRRSDAINHTQSELLAMEAASRGLTVQAAPYIETLKKQETAMGLYSGSARDARVSTNQLRVAMQQLPAQFTDVFTSLAGGQNPLLVLIQQGGQVRDSFGGIGNALRGIQSILTPVRLAIGGAAAAIGTLGFAYKQASDETDNYRRALVLSGNATGVSVGQLQALAVAVSAAGGTQGKAAEVLTVLAGSARVAGADLKRLTEAAVALERAGGPAATATAKAFTDLGKNPTQAALTLNESVKFLTGSVYEQIKALESQGRTAEAAAVAQRAYATAVTAQAKELETGLGSLQRAWRGVSDVAKDAWDKMLGLGREDSPETRLAAVSKALAEARARLAVPSGQSAGLPGLSGSNNVKALERQESALVEDVEFRRLAGVAKAFGIKAEEAKIELKKMADDDAFKTPGERLKKALLEFQNLSALGNQGDTEEAKKLERLIKLYSAANAEGVAIAQGRLAAETALASDQLAALQKRIQFEAELVKIKGSTNPLARLNDEIQLINELAEANRKASLAEQSRLSRAVALAKSLPNNAQGVVAAEAAVSAEQRNRAQIEIDRLAAVETARARQAQGVKAAMTALRDEGESAIEGLEQQASGATAAIEKSLSAYAQGIRDAAKAMELEQSLAGESQRTRQVAIEQFQITLDLRRRIAEIEATTFAGDRNQAARLRNQAIAEAEAAAAIAKAGVSSKAAFDPAPLDAASAAVKDYLDEVTRAGKATQDATRQTMSLLEDDLVSSFATGRFSVKRTVDFMIQEFLRLQVVRPMLKGLFGGENGGGFNWASLAGMFNGGGGAAGASSLAGAGGGAGNFNWGGGFKDGGAFSSSGPIPLASGAVFNAATPFSAGGQRYVMAEAGPEAVMPLKRGSDGKLGVAASGSAPTIVNNMTVNGDVSPQTVALLNAAMAKNNAQLIRGMKTGAIGS